MRQKVAAQAAIAPTDTLSTPVFVRALGANTDPSRAKLRTLAGMEDFVRTTGYYSRWGSHPTMRHSYCERICLDCVLNTTEERLDSDWHNLMFVGLSPQ